MAEQSDEQVQSGPQDERGDPAAIGLALGGASRAEADAFLRKQARLVDLQIERIKAQDDHIDEEQRLTLSHMRVRRFGDYTRMALEALVGVLILATIMGLASMVINASGDRDLVFDTLSVPPDLAARGITGAVVSARLLDRFAAMEAETTTITQDAESFRSISGGNIRIAIPNTGISLGELDQYLRDWLGDETHISGEIVRSGGQLAMTVRFGHRPGVTLTGSEQDLSSIVQSAAESLYRQVLPLRYSDLLIQQGRYQEALTILSPLSLYGAAPQRAGALASWAELLNSLGEPRKALELALVASRLAPNDLYTQWVLPDCYQNLGHDEDEVAADRRVVQIGQGLSGTVASDTANGWLLYKAWGLERTGDFQGGLATLDHLMEVTEANSGYDSLVMLNKAMVEALAHDIATARTAQLPDVIYSYPPRFGALWLATLVDTAAGDWSTATDDGEKALELGTGHKETQPALVGHTVGIVPALAIAHAHLGNFSRAHVLIDPTPLDCDACVRARGSIAGLQHEWRAASRWFAMVDERSPSIPLTDVVWGEMLLAKGDLDSAIDKFALANRKSEHFADPLEMWGEALMLKNHSDLALVKFEDANKYAPNWGRLHMKWGEALGYVGREGEARAQYRIASTLDLSLADKAELARDMRS